MVKFFTTNANRKIEFTKDELENLLNEVWNDGYNHHGSYWWTSPTITTPYYSTGTPIVRDGITVTCSSGRREDEQTN